MAQNKISEQEMAFILDRMESFGPGASLRDKVWSIWVKGSGSKWVYNSVSGTYKVLSAEKLLREYGFAGFRTTGLEITPDPISRVDGMTEEDIAAHNEAAIDGFDMGGTVVAHDGTIWVNSSNGEWFHETKEGGYIFLSQDEFLRENGPVVARSNGKVLLRIPSY